MTTRATSILRFGCILLLLLVTISASFAFSFGVQHDLDRHQRTNPLAASVASSSSSSSSSPSSTTSTSLDDKLMGIAKKLRLHVLDLEEGIYGYDSQDNRFGLEVVHSEIDLPDDDDNDGLGLGLTELAASESRDGRGLVLISDVFGAAATTTTTITTTVADRSSTQQGLQVGDVLVGVRVKGTPIVERLTGLDYDMTVEAIGRAKHAAATAAKGSKSAPNTLCFEANRLVERAPITVEVVEDPTTTTWSSPSVRTIEALAGENLRRLLQRKGIQMYNRSTKRFDMPYATGDCAGEGLCGTCLVNVVEGMGVLSPKDDLEEFITKGRPISWRASCRTVVGHDNRPGTLRIETQPQTNLQDEIDPGVRSVRHD